MAAYTRLWWRVFCGKHTWEAFPGSRRQACIEIICIFAPGKPESGTERPITVREGKDILLGKLRSSSGMTRGEQIRLTFLLALPSIFAQLSSCLMSYIDAAMVGALGSAQAAAVGLVSTTTWIFGSFCYANSSGFSVRTSPPQGPCSVWAYAACSFSASASPRSASR